MSADNDDTWRVTVYREDPAWDRLGDAKWFHLNSADLNRLYVGAYEIEGNPSETHPAVIWLRQEHPNCVFVY